MLQERLTGWDRERVEKLVAEIAEKAVKGEYRLEPAFRGDGPVEAEDGAEAGTKAKDADAEAALIYLIGRFGTDITRRQLRGYIGETIEGFIRRARGPVRVSLAILKRTVEEIIEGVEDAPKPPLDPVMTAAYLDSVAGNEFLRVATVSEDEYLRGLVAGTVKLSEAEAPPFKDFYNYYAGKTWSMIIRRLVTPETAARLVVGEAKLILSRRGVEARVTVARENGETVVVAETPTGRAQLRLDEAVLSSLRAAGDSLELARTVHGYAKRLLEEAGVSFEEEIPFPSFLSMETETGVRIHGTFDGIYIVEVRGHGVILRGETGEIAEAVRRQVEEGEEVIPPRYLPDIARWLLRLERAPTRAIKFVANTGIPLRRVAPGIYVSPDFRVALIEPGAIARRIKEDSRYRPVCREDISYFSDLLDLVFIKIRARSRGKSGCMSAIIGKVAVPAKALRGVLEGCKGSIEAIRVRMKSLLDEPGPVAVHLENGSVVLISPAKRTLMMELADYIAEPGE